jgi:hypothetical protein
MPFGNCGPLDAWMKKIRNDFDAPRKLKATISERLDWAIRRAMSGDPENRPSSCKEFVEDLLGTALKPSQTAPAPPALESGIQEVWYIVYRDEDGVSHTVKGTSEGIRRALKDALLGDTTNIKACRNKQGPFQMLREFPEFRDLVVQPGVGQHGGGSSGQMRPVSSTRPASAPQLSGPPRSQPQLSGPPRSHANVDPEDAIGGDLPITPSASRRNLSGSRLGPPVIPGLSGDSGPSSGPISGIKIPYVPIETPRAESSRERLLWLTIFVLLGLLSGAVVLLLAGKQLGFPG